ncbi:hypothetical protein [Nonomuraea ceibae]|uniref:hypothetical protein n=1 Tax=Nonomuraea ceibae TaxID=1935170 RepID=UPI001C5D6643|nr:hypothetical protein [Nonomuraea ceibae]
MRDLAVAAAIAGAMVIAAPAGATATTATAPSGPDELGPLSASGCTARNGPGHVNETCIQVTGTGTLVQKIRGSMRSIKFPWRPITLCGVKVHVWGAYKSGAAFNETRTAQCSKIGDAYVDWAPFTMFRVNSTLCARTFFDNEWSNPACITIKSA